MSVYIHRIATAVPENAIPQDTIRDAIKAQLGEEKKLERLAHRIYAQSGIAKRHSVIPDFNEVTRATGSFYDHQTDTFKLPSTKVRNDFYTETSRPLFGCVARKAIEQCPSIEVEHITHLITVSCTGFFSPGPDYFIVKDLGLSPTTQRFHVGFMGCFAAFPALKMAQAFCEADPNANVLIVCVELCTLHIQPSTNLDRMLSASVFSDGAAAAIVSSRKPRADALRMIQFASTVTPTGEEDMAWTIGDTGFDIVLSSYVPALIEANIEDAVSILLNQCHLQKADINHWAVHPGGRAILDKVVKGLGLEKNALDSARNVLCEYGNMSSATILFVLKELMTHPAKKDDETICAMAFGPGLTVELGLFVHTSAEV